MRRPVCPAAATVPAVVLAVGAVCAAGRPFQAPASRAAAPVAIDFRATTGAGELVTDLKREELTLRVDGRERAIRSLDLIQFGEEQAGAGSAPIAPPFATNALSDAGRSVLLVVDEDSIAPGREQPIRDAAGRMLAELSARDRIGLVAVPRGGANIGQTAQHDRIRSGLAAMTSRAQTGESGSDLACRTRLTLEALGDVFGALAGESPATVVFFSAGMAPPSSDRAQLNVSSGLCEVRPEHFNDLATAALASRTHFYVVHVLDAAGAAGSAGAASLALGLESLAGVTGGEFIRVLGDNRAAMARVARETAAYYTLTFDPEPADRNGSSHRVALEASRAGVEVRARRQVTIPKPDVRAARARPPAPRDMLRVGTVYRDLPLRAASYAAPNAGDDRVKVVVLLEPLDASVALASAAVGLFDERGKLAAQWTARSDDLARAPVMAALVVREGAYRLRVAASDKSGRGGTVDDDVRAEIARAGALTLSALVLGTSENGSFAPRLQFVAEPAAIGYFEIHGAAAAAPVSATIELAAASGGGAVIEAVPATIMTAASGGFRIAYGAIPVANLAPGDYVVRAAVSLDGRTAGLIARTLRKAKPAS